MEPDQQGVYNETYLGIIKEQVQLLEQHGLYVFLDMHQDVLESRLGTYNGVPGWVVDKLPRSSNHPYPWPFGDKSHFKGGGWALQYLTKDCGLAFQGLYDNANGTQDNLAAFWRKVAETFVGMDSVMGYELINEPWAGDVISRPSLFEPGIAGRHNLFPMYEKIAKAIREVDNVTIIMTEPVTWGVVLNGKHP